MNSPARALVWELFWKNRWGFTLLLFLFALCGVFRLFIGHLQAEALRAAAAFPSVSSGSLWVSDLLPETASKATLKKIEIRADGNLMWSGLLRANARISWVGELGIENQPSIQIRVNEGRLNGHIDKGARTMAEGTTTWESWEVGEKRPLPSRLVISIENDGRHTVSLMEAQHQAQDIGLAYYRAVYLGWYRRRLERRCDGLHVAGPLRHFRRG